MNLYRNEGSHPLTNAQRNLMGRTHYVDPDTLRWHKSRVLSARPTDEGLLFCITTSDALDMHNTKRGYRYVFGTVLDRPELNKSFARHEAALKAMWKSVNAIDAKAVTLAAIEKSRESYAREMDRLTEETNKIEARPIAA